MAKRPLDRRRHLRRPLACQIILFDDGTDPPLRTHTLNVSDGGVYLSVPTRNVPEQGRQMSLKLLVPRSTPNTYMLEEFNAPAKIVRHDMLLDNTQVGVAVQFLQQVNLALDV